MFIQESLALLLDVLELVSSYIFRFSTTLSRCGCNISRWGACGRIFMHTQLIFMHFILMVPPCASGGALQVGR